MIALVFFQTFGAGQRRDTRAPQRAIIDWRVTMIIEE
jgi:hypothetical protein